MKTAYEGGKLRLYYVMQTLCSCGIRVPCNATEEKIVVAENLIGSVLDEVQRGLGYADARAKSNVIIFNAWLGGNTDGYAYGELVNIANNAIFQYSEMSC